MKRFIFLAVTGVVLLASMASAQVETQGRIVVVVEDPQGSRLPGATVTASAEDSITSRESVTNSVGEVNLVGLDPSSGYVVQVAMPGFSPSRTQAVLVRAGQTASLRVQLSLAGVAESVTVTSQTPLVDTTSAITGQDITLDLTESLPTGRTYQSYLQLVPGVMPEDPSQSGNPASKSGLNYSDVRGEVGVSRDNFYYIDGINVTDGVTGTFGANLNTEIIQEQTVLTGGVPAEYIGSSGLLSNVVLKAGSNTLSGSANYFFQNDSLQLENTNLPGQKFSRFDAAGTIGGPILTDKAWFFGSYRRLERNDDVVANDTQEFLRTVNQSEDQVYARATVSPTGQDTFSFTFLNDPLERNGRRDPDISNAQDRGRNQGGNRFNAKYSRLIGMSTLLDVGFNKHNGEVSDFSAIDAPENVLLFDANATFTRADQELGGWGETRIDERDTKLFRVALDHSLDRHDIKAGFEWKSNENVRDFLTLGSPAASWTSLDASLAGATAGRLEGPGISGNLAFQPSNSSDFGGFIRTIEARPDRQVFFDAYDVNSDGTITPEELAATMTFNSTAGNPDNRLNYDRTAQTADGEQLTSSRGLSFYGQDSFRMGNFVFNAGLRVEQWRHFDTAGDESYTFPWMFAPRLSAVYDVMGDGQQTISAFWGRYYDPIRNNMSNFAGSVTGRVREEQVWANAVNDFVTYRTRGGPSQPDALFAPTTETPYTDDLQLRYEIDLGDNMSFEALYTNRRTRQILEDYDLALYAFGTDGVSTDYGGPLDHPDSLWLGLDYFGYDQNPGSNFVIGTLAGGKRDYQGVEFALRKRFTGRWQALVAYTYNDAEGNTNSDSNADFQGDVIWLDPRAPNQFGTQPGLIRHLFKAATTYQFDVSDNGSFEVGGFLQANNGFQLSRTESLSSRNLPIRTSSLGQPNFEFAGWNRSWLAPGVVGTVDNPGWGQLDLRFQYVHRFTGNMRLELFADVFNITNTQAAFRLVDVVAGDGALNFGDESDWVRPQRWFLGARINF